jgi:two-component system, OmpR family, alkaline phosphatase synthesis response regulator PhoP
MASGRVAWRGAADARGTAAPKRSRQPRRRNRSDRERGGVIVAPLRAYDGCIVKRVLVVDDEPEIVRLVRDYLERAGFEVTTAANGAQALREFSRQRPDLVILDLTLPETDGLDVARAIRRTGEVPIIMLTARTDEADRVAGLELGADDYVTKPFSARELVARVRAVMRRAQTAAMREDVVRVGDSLVLDAPRMQAHVDGRDVILTATEFQLLLYMARQPGRVFTRAQLLDAVHGVAIESYERAVDAHVKNIRRKIERDPRAPQHLQTVFGVGYRLVDGTA